jgi:hypothetical protein
MGGIIVVIGVKARKKGGDDKNTRSKTNAGNPSHPMAGSKVEILTPILRNILLSLF